MIHCQARIVKTYKSKKFRAVWPVTASGVNPNIPEGSPVCNGDVTVAVRAVYEPDWGGHYGRLHVEITCLRCQDPYFDGIIPLMSGGLSAEQTISNILNWALAGETYSCTRASGEALCKHCQRPLRDHPMSTHRSHDGHPFLHQLCDGTLVKL